MTSIQAMDFMQNPGRRRCAFSSPARPIMALAAQAGQPDPLETAFAQAREAYFAAKYEDAKTVLEKLIADLAAVEGRDSFKGETFLLMGATYEKLKLKELAIKYFCRAKAILGEGKTIEGLELKKLKYYRRTARAPPGRSPARPRSGGEASWAGCSARFSSSRSSGSGPILLWTYVIKKIRYRNADGHHVRLPEPVSARPGTSTSTRNGTAIRRGTSRSRRATWPPIPTRTTAGRIR